MKINISFFSLFLFILFCPVNHIFGQDGLKIVIIRHAEKPDKGDNLSCEGLNRSIQLPPVLYKKIGVPNQIYAPAINTGKVTTTARMYQTIVPFAVKYNLHINTRYDVKDIVNLATEIKNRTGIVLLVWEHKAIIKIANALGINENLSWDDDDFDSIWTITIIKGISRLTRDKENIKPAADCL